MASSRAQLLRPRRRDAGRRPLLAPRRYAYRATIWTWIAPAALLLAVIVAVGIVRDGLDRPPKAQLPAVASTSAATGGATTPAKPRKKAFYRIKAGDTFSSVALRFKTDVDALAKLNPNVDPQALQPGQRLRVS